MFYFLDNHFWYHLELVLLFVTSLTLMIFSRYLLISVLYQIIVRTLYATSIQFLARVRVIPSRVQIRRELKWAFCASLVFSALCTLSLLAYQNGLTLLYTNIYEYSLMYFFISPLLILALYETYYYWLHRWMHLPKIFKHIHKAHHESISPTVFTAFCFHPLEAILQFIFFPIVVMVIPVHLAMLGALFLVLSFFAVVNHGGIEIYNAGTRKFLIGASHHDLHHQRFRTNFGLNFTWWDKLMNTEGKDLPEKE